MTLMAVSDRIRINSAEKRAHFASHFCRWFSFIKIMARQSKFLSNMYKGGQTSIHARGDQMLFNIVWGFEFSFQT